MYAGKKKPEDIASFLNPTIDEFICLSPDANRMDGEHLPKRPLTASIRCIIADTPMTSYLKRTKSYSGYWACDRCIQPGEKINGGAIQLRNVNAPLRNDHDFLQYFVNDFSSDDHTDPTDISPLVRLHFRMVSGFTVEPMHSMVEGSFGRRLTGVISVVEEGKISNGKLREADSRLAIYREWRPNDFDRFLGKVSNFSTSKMHVKRQFLYYLCFPVFEGILEDSELEHIMMLQYAMFLLGSFNYIEVEESNIKLAESVLKQYCVELLERNIPCRFVTHQIIHMPQDVARYKCGIETLSAFQFESFLSFFRRSLKSGNLPAEQIRNRLIEKHKYQLPTTSSGEIIENKVSLALEAKKRFSKSMALIKFVSNGVKRPKRLIFYNFELTNKPPNNVCLLNDGSFVVCYDFERSSGDSVIIIGRKFLKLQNAFVKPYVSSKFNVFIGSNLSNNDETWEISNLKCKVYILPRMPKGKPNIEDHDQEWHLQPMLHSMLKFS